MAALFNAPSGTQTDWITPSDLYDATPQPNDMDSLTSYMEMPSYVTFLGFGGVTVSEEEWGVVL